MRTLLLRITFVVALSLLTPCHAVACSCAYPEPCQAYWAADVVFVGRVVSTSEQPVEMDLGAGKKRYMQMLATLEVEEAFRGVDARTVEITAGFDEIYDWGHATNSCDIFFGVGERHIIYARRNPTYGFVAASKCLRSRVIDDFAHIAPDLDYAREAAAGRSRPGLFGTLFADPVPGSTEHPPNERLSGVRLTLEGKRRYEIVTGPDGAYHEEGIEPGVYRVRVELPKGLRLLRAPEQETVTIPEHGCVALSFEATRYGSVAGRLLEASGRPASGISLRLLSADGDDGADPVGYTTSAADGTYRFEAVPPGRYLIAVNPEGPPAYVREEEAYPPAFYPGGKDRSRAATVALVRGQQIQLKSFSLGARLPTVDLVVTVVDSSGAPAASASVLYAYTASSKQPSAGATADAEGRATLRLYRGFTYRVHAESLRGDPRRLSGEVVIKATPEPKSATLTIR